MDPYEAAYLAASSERERLIAALKTAAEVDRKTYEEWHEHKIVSALAHKVHGHPITLLEHEVIQSGKWRVFATNQLIGSASDYEEASKLFIDFIPNK